MNIFFNYSVFDKCTRITYKTIPKSLKKTFMKSHFYFKVTLTKLKVKFYKAALCSKS